LNILFFTNEYSHPNLPTTGGLGTFIQTISKKLTNNGHTVYIFGFAKKKITFNDGKINVYFIKKYTKAKPFSELARSISKSLKINKIQYYFLKKERKYYSKKLKNFAKKNKIDIIESFVFDGYNAFWDNSIPLVLRFHGSRGFWNYYLNHKKENLLIKLEKISLSNTKYNIAVSHFTKNAINKIYNIDVLKVIHNGVDVSKFKKIKNKDTFSYNIFYYGTLSDAKGVNILCEVFNEIIKIYPKAKLNIIGRGEKYKQHLINNVLSILSKKNTTFYSNIQHNDIPKILQNADICIFPSKNETFGLTVTEAMACEKVVITSNIGSFKEIIINNKNGFIANNHTEYIKYISYCFDNFDKALEIGKNARKHIVNNFSLDKLAFETIEYYNYVINDFNK